MPASPPIFVHCRRRYYIIQPTYKSYWKKSSINVDGFLIESPVHFWSIYRGHPLNISIDFCFPYYLGDHCNYHVTDNDLAWNEYIRRGETSLITTMTSTRGLDRVFIEIGSFISKRIRSRCYSHWSSSPFVRAQTKIFGNDDDEENNQNKKKKKKTTNNRFYR